MDCKQIFPIIFPLFIGSLQKYNAGLTASVTKKSFIFSSLFFSSESTIADVEAGEKICYLNVFTVTSPVQWLYSLVR